MVLKRPICYSKCGSNLIQLTGRSSRGSQAVNTFIKYGNIGHLEKISRTSLRPKLTKENWARKPINL